MTYQEKILKMREKQSKNQLVMIYTITTLFLATALIIGLINKPIKNTSGMAIGVGEAPDGFASPYDPYNYNDPLMKITITPINNKEFTATIDVTHKEEPGKPAYVYKKGYYLSKGSWQEFEFPQETAGDSDWIIEHGKAVINEEYNNYVINSNEEEFVAAAYSCKLYDNEWKCGCRAIGDCGYWMIQSADLGDPATGRRLEVSPRSIVTSLDDKEISVDINLYNGNNVYGFEFEIEYDPHVLEFAGISDGNYLGSKRGSDYLCVDYRAEEGSIKQISCTSTGTKLHQGSGTLKTIHFKKKASGYSQIRITKSNVALWDDINIEGSEPRIESWPVNNGYINVNS